MPCHLPAWTASVTGLFVARSLTVTSYVPATSGVNSGYGVVAALSVAVDPAGARSVQLYDSCVLPCSKTGRASGTLRSPVAVGYGSDVATVAGNLYEPEVVTTLSSRPTAPAFASAVGEMPATPHRFCMPFSYSPGGKNAGIWLSVSGRAFNASTSVSRKVASAGSVTAIVSVVVFASVAVAPAVCFHLMLCRLLPSAMVIVAFRFTVAPGAGAPVVAKVTFTGGSAANALPANIRTQQSAIAIG